MSTFASEPVPQARSAGPEPSPQAHPAADQEWLSYVNSIQARGENYLRRFRISFSFRLIVSAMAGDFFAVLAALSVAAWIYGGFGSGWGRSGGEAALLLLLINQFGGYELSRLRRFRAAAPVIGRATFLWLFVCPGVFQLLQPTGELERTKFLLGGVVAGLLVAGWRRLLQIGLHGTAMAKCLRRRILFLGWSGEADRLAARLSGDEDQAFEIIGRLTLHANEPTNSASACAECREAIGSEEDLDLLLSQDVADVVIASGPEATQNSLLLHSNLCEKWMVDFKLIPSCFEALVSGLNLEKIGGTPLLGISKLPLDSTFNLVLKRAVDILGGLVGLMLSAPLILFFGALIFLEERRGPIFFAQERYGRKGRKFRMYKLRSMRLGSEKSDHLNQSTLRADPRVLRIGGFMRKFNIDEVPQFWNVLKGDMSLVGPRPERTYHSELLSDEIPHYNARYNICPGITGWAQVNGLRGDTDLTERVKCDLYYIENWSLWLDIRIMFRTLIGNKNAY